MDNLGSKKKNNDWCFKPSKSGKKAKSQKYTDKKINEFCEFIENVENNVWIDHRIPNDYR